MHCVGSAESTSTVDYRTTVVGFTISLVGIGIYRSGNNKLSTDTILPTLALLIFRVSFQ